MTPKEVLALCREKDVKAIDMRFMDFPGLWQHFTIPVSKLDEDVFEEPNRFKVDRDPNRHIGFGIGEHFCLGAYFARMELNAVFRNLVARL